jgi:hypothetical protein
MDRKLVQEEDGDDPRRRRCNVGGKDMLDPIEHDLLIEPRLFIEAVDAVCGEGGTSLRAIVPLGIPAMRMQQSTIMLVPVFAVQKCIDLPLNTTSEGS